MRHPPVPTSTTQRSFISLAMFCALIIF